MGFLPRWFEKAGNATSWWKGCFLERCPPSVEVGAVSFSGFGGATKKNQESEKNMFIHHFDAYFFYKMGVKPFKLLRLGTA